METEKVEEKNVPQEQTVSAVVPSTTEPASTPSELTQEKKDTCKYISS
jgi:hypothetical protein